MGRTIQKWIGNILIILSFSGLMYIYYPFIKELLFPPKITESVRHNTAFSIEIPKIQVFSEIIPYVDPFNKEQYMEQLKKGVAHAKNTALPGEGKTVYLFAHSSDVPWRITRYNTAFFKLEFLEKKDKIIIRKNGEEYLYEVMYKRTVWPSESKYLTESQGDVLILQNCTPVGTAFPRLLGFAKPID